MIGCLTSDSSVPLLFVRNLYVSGAQLSGTLPSCFGTMTKLKQFYFSDNELVSARARARVCVCV